jgi:hypothetical protein
MDALTGQVFPQPSVALGSASAHLIVRQEAWLEPNSSPDLMWEIRQVGELSVPEVPHITPAFLASQMGNNRALTRFWGIPVSP